MAPKSNDEREALLKNSSSAGNQYRYDGDGGAIDVRPFRTTQDSNVDRKSTTNNNTSAAATSKTYLFAFCAALNSCNLGYDIGASTNAGPRIQADFDLSNRQLEVFLGSINFWSIWGALLSPIVTDRFGRRTTFGAAAIGFIVGCAIMSTAQSFTALMIGRFFVGIGVGIGEAVDPMYIAEISPKEIRGELVSWAEAGVAVGVVLGFSSSLLLYYVPDGTEWRYMLALGAVLPFVMLFLVAKVMPESPRYLLSKEKDAEARRILKQIYPHGYDVEEIVNEIHQSLAVEKEASNAVGWETIYKPSPAVRRMLLVGVGVAIIQQAVGIDSVMFYLMFVIRQSGIKSELHQIMALIVLGTVKLAFVFVGAKWFDKLGRRPLLFASLLGCAASLVLVSVMFASDSSWSKIMTVVGLACYLACFSSGLGPGNWVVVSELFATSIRAKAMSVAVLPNRITATLMASSFLSVAHALTWPGFFLLLAAICLASAAFLYLYLPETRGRSLEAMSVYFAEITGDRSILDVEKKLAEKTRALADASHTELRLRTIA